MWDLQPPSQTMLSPIRTIAARAAMHHRYEPGTSWSKAWRLALSIPFQRLDQVRLARQALACYDLPGARAAFVSASGNLVFRVEAGGQRFALRISQPGRRTVEQVRAELAFAADLHQQLHSHTPLAIPGRNGEPVQVVAHDHAGTRIALLFPWISGEMMGHRPTPWHMEHIARAQARMHVFTLSQKPTYATARPVLDMEEVLRWTVLPHRAAALVSEKDRSLMARLGGHLQQVLPRLLEQSPKTLLHFDLQGSNLLFEGDQLGIIDLDDCQVAPVLLDVATTLTYTTTKPDADALRSAWLKGYLSVPGVPAPDPKALDAAIALIAMREAQRVLEWPRLTTHPWGPGVLHASLNVLHAQASRMG